MKKFFFVLTLFLAMIFSPFIFAAGLIANAPELSSFEVPVFVSVLQVLEQNCHDVQEYNKNAVLISKSNQSKDRAIILENTVSTFGKDEIVREVFKGAAHRTGIGLVLPPMTANQNTKLYTG